MATENVDREFAARLGKTAEAYGIVLTPMRIRIYARALADLTKEEFTRAIGSAVRQCKFFPTVADIRAAVEAPVQDRALMAWSWLQRKAEDIGIYQTLECDDPALVHALEDVFGAWPAYCEMKDGPAMAMKRQEFLASYKAAAHQLGRGQLTATMRVPGLLGDAPGPKELASGKDS